MKQYAQPGSHEYNPDLHRPLVLLVVPSLMLLSVVLLGFALSMLPSEQRNTVISTATPLLTIMAVISLLVPGAQIAGAFMGIRALQEGGSPNQRLLYWVCVAVLAAEMGLLMTLIVMALRR